MNLLKKLRLEPTYDPWVVKGQNLLNFLSKGPRRLPGSRGFACINGSTIATSILVAMQPTGAAQEMSFWGLRIPWLWVKLPWHWHPFSVPQNSWVMDVHSPKFGDSRFWPIFRVELDPLPDIWAPCGPKNCKKDMEIVIALSFNKTLCAQVESPMFDG